MHTMLYGSVLIMTNGSNIRQYWKTSVYLTLANHQHTCIRLQVRFHQLALPCTVRQSFAEMITFQVSWKAHALKRKNRRKDGMFAKLIRMHSNFLAQNNYIQIALSATLRRHFKTLLSKDLSKFTTQK